MKKIEKVIRGWRKFPGKSGLTANSYLATISKATGNTLKNDKANDTIEKISTRSIR
jgi:hypothetical protein